MEGMGLRQVAMHPLVMLVMMINAILGNVMGSRDELHENPQAETENADGQGVDPEIENMAVDTELKENIEIGIETEIEGEGAPEVVREKEE